MTIQAVGTSIASQVLNDNFSYLEAQRIALSAETVTGWFNVKTGYGAIGNGSIDDYTAINNAILAAIANNGGIVYFPSGTYKMSTYPAALRQEIIVTTKDLKNIILMGAGRSSIIKGISSIGHDVLQLNGVKNITVRDLAITSEKTTPADTTQGCNGISATNGTNNVTIENIYVYDLPYVVKATYVDGGKPFTVQPGSLGVEACSNIKIINNESSNCPFGFNSDTTGTSTLQSYGIEVTGNTFRAFYQGITCGSSAPASGSYVAKLMYNIDDNVIIGAQLGLFLSRVSGTFTNNQMYSELTAIPTAISIDTKVVPIIVESCEHAVVKNNFTYYSRCDSYVRAGGTGSGPSQFCSFKDNQFTGNSDTAGILAVDFGGNTIKNSVFANNQFRNVTTVNYDLTLYTAVNDNVIVTNGAGTRFEKMGIGTLGDIVGADQVINGTLGFAYTDGKTAYSFIFRNGIPLAVKQTISSAGSTKVWQVLSSSDVDLFDIANDGSIQTNQVSVLAVPATQNKRIPIYNAAGTLEGYIPVYT